VLEGRSTVFIAVVTALRPFWEVFWSTVHDVQVELCGLAESGSEVVGSNTAHMRGRQEIEVSARSTFVWTVENGQITRFRMFQERARPSKPSGCVSSAGAI
jgi:ketosteroid isomerase-like protein